MGFEGTFILPHRASVLSFPYDHQELSIQICTDEPKNCEFRPARPNPCILKREALATLQNWVGVREKKKQSEMGKKKKGRFLKFSAKQVRVSGAQCLAYSPAPLCAFPTESGVHSIK